MNGLASLWAHAIVSALSVVVCAFLTGCDPSNDRPVVTLYTSVDEPFAREVIAAFEKESGIRVALKIDSEAGKTTGLVRRIEAERSRPQADVFWSSELFNTIKMGQQGLLAEYRPAAVGIPDRYKDPSGRWTAFGLRARVLAFNTSKVKPEELPTRWRDMADSRWAGALGVADPRFGTTRGHFAAFLAAWGEPAYVEFVDQLSKTLGDKLQDGNATAARAVGRGELLVCATDTDDVYVRQDAQEPIDMVFPDMGDGGTLLIPNSVAMIANAPHPDTARKLMDFLTSEQTERMLAQSDSRNYPVRESLRKELNITLPSETKLTFDQIADAMDKAIELAGRKLIK
ncbi:MAG: extracellular solute-binding protein [Phycisphaerae bacterium]|nr:extracellular solute-binding protein [Phycisphaerae bacterium]